MIRACVALTAALAIGATAACKSDDPLGAPVAGLRFVAAPAAVVAAGEPFTVTVEVLDSTGTRTTSSADVTLSVNRSGAVSGPTAVRSNGGLAKFAALRFSKTDTNLVMTATSGDITISTAPFRVGPGAVSALTTTMSPSITGVPQEEPTAVVLTLRDAPGNPISGARVILSSTSTGVTFTPDTVTTKADGTINTTFQSASAGSATINATIDATTIAVGSAIRFCSLGSATFPGTVSGTITAQNCLSGGVATAPYRFTVNAATGAAFSVTSNFAPLLEVRTHPTTDNIVPPTPTQGAPVEWLLPAGTYQVRVSGPANGGTFSITGATAAGNTGCPPHRYLLVAGTYTGQRLASGDCTFEDASLYDRFVIYSKSGCGVTVTSTDFEPWLFIYDQTANQFIDGRGGLGDATLHIGMSSCRNLGHPIAFLINADPGFAGAYTLTIQVIATATLRASGAASASADDGAPSASVVRRIMAMKAARRTPR